MICSVSRIWLQFWRNFLYLSMAGFVLYLLHFLYFSLSLYIYIYIYIYLWLVYVQSSGEWSLSSGCLLEPVIYSLLINICCVFVFSLKWFCSLIQSETSPTSNSFNSTSLLDAAAELSTMFSAVGILFALNWDYFHNPHLLWFVIVVNFPVLITNF